MPALSKKGNSRHGGPDRRGQGSAPAARPSNKGWAGSSWSAPCTHPCTSFSEKVSWRSFFAPFPCVFSERRKRAVLCVFLAFSKVFYQHWRQVGKMTTEARNQSSLSWPTGRTGAQWGGYSKEVSRAETQQGRTQGSSEPEVHQDGEVKVAFQQGK